MANKKKNQQIATGNEALSANTLENNASVASDAAKNNKTKKDGKPGFFAKIGKVFKEMFSEIKKINWPTWKITLASLGTVLVVVLLFLIVVMGFDTFCSWLLSLLTQTDFKL